MEMMLLSNVIHQHGIVLPDCYERLIYIKFLPWMTSLILSLRNPSRNMIRSNQEYAVLFISNTRRQGVSLINLHTIRKNLRHRNNSRQRNKRPQIRLTPLWNREYVILALDAPKKRVVTTRFRRLLDGSPNVPLSSSENLLKVEHLSRYVALH